MAKRKIDTYTAEELQEALHRRFKIDEEANHLSLREQIDAIDAEIADAAQAYSRLVEHRRELSKGLEYRKGGMRLTSADLHTQWVMHHHRFFKADGYTINLTKMSNCLNIDYYTLMFWVKTRHPDRVSSAGCGATGTRVNVGMPAIMSEVHHD